MKIGSLEIKKARFGNTEITKMYLGSLLVYQKTEEGLPARYQKVAYLQSSQTNQAWLNLGQVWNDNMKVEMEFKELQSSSTGSVAYVLGSQSSYNFAFGVRDFNPQAICYKLGTSGNAQNSGLSIDQTIWNTIAITTTTVSLNGTSVALTGEYTNPNVDFYLFSTNRGGSPYSMNLLQLFTLKSFKIYNGNTLTHNYVPCYDTENGNKPGMYDLASRQFLVNQGTGADFIVGPDVHDLPAEFQEVEYLQGDGNAYIGNIWQPTLNMKVETSFQCQTITSIEGIFGYYDVGGTNIRYGIRVSSTGAIQVANWTTSWTSVGITYDTNKHKYIIDSVNDMFYYDDQSFSIPKTKTEQLGTQSNTLFAYYGNYESKGKMFYQKVWEGTTLTHHYIPCYNKTTLVAGMYDLITKQFKTNSGTGSFIVGPDIN